MSERITPSLVISIIALIVAIGGVSYAAVKIPKNSVGTKQLKKGAVKTAKLKKGAVSTAKIKGDAVTAAKLKDGSVGASELQDGSVDSANLGNDSVDSAKVKDGSLGRSDFAPGQITGDAWYAARDSTDLFDLTANFVPVVTTPVLPAGSYVLAARANVLGGGGVANTLICSMENDAAQNFTVGSGTVFPLSMAATAVLAEPSAVQLNCQKSSGSPRIAQAHIIVTQVNGVTES
jgi:hypothetical protein